MDDPDDYEPVIEEDEPPIGPTTPDQPPENPGKEQKDHVTRKVGQAIKRQHRVHLRQAADQRDETHQQTWTRSSVAALQSSTVGTRPPSQQEHVRRPSSDPKDFPAFAAELPPGHDPFTIGGYIACRRCALISSGQKKSCKLLDEPCRGDFPKWSDGPLNNLKAGFKPSWAKRWPDEG